MRGKSLKRKWGQINRNFFCLKGILKKGLLNPETKVNVMSHENLRLYKSMIKLIGSKGLKTGILMKVMYIDYSEFRAKVLNLGL